jgi:hypothetical protein
MAALPFLYLYEKYGKWTNPENGSYIKWGDEIEGHRFKKTPGKGY